MRGWEDGKEVEVDMGKAGRSGEDLNAGVLCQHGLVVVLAAHPFAHIAAQLELLWWIQFLSSRCTLHNGLSVREGL